MTTYIKKFAKLFFEMTFYKIKVIGIDRCFQFQFEPNQTVDDLCKFMQDLLGTSSNFEVLIYGSSIKKTFSKLIDIAPEYSCLTLRPPEPNPQYQHELVYYKDTKDDEYIVFSNITVKTMIEGEIMKIDENKNVKQLKLEIREKFINKYSIDRNQKINLFLPSGCQFLSGTINDFKNSDTTRIFRRHLYVIVTDDIMEEDLEEEIINTCDASTDEKKSLLSPCYKNSSIKGLCTMASILGYINQNGEDSDYIVTSFSRFFPFAPLICALHQLQTRNTVRGLTIIQITAPIFTILRDFFSQTIEDANLLEYTPQLLTYFINLDINGTIPCTIYIEPFMKVSTEAYLNHIKEKNKIKGKMIATLWDPDFRGIDWIFYKYTKPTKEDIDTACENVHSLSIIPPIDLRKIRRSALFQGVNGPWLFLNGTYGKKKEEQDNFDIVNPEKGITESINPEELAKEIFSKVRGSMTIDIVDPKKVSQIVYILLDKSSSMFEEYNGTTRFEAAKQYLISFLDAAYTSLNFSLFGLIAFDQNYTIACDLTILTPQFRDELEKIKEGGSTAIFKTMQAAAEELVEAHKKYCNAIKRIIVLTDGFDNHADYTWEGQRYFHYDISKVAQFLIDNQIRVDCLYVFDEADARLFKITKMTGGCAFYPSSIEEGLNIFAEEPFYNVLIRDFKPFSTERLNHDKIQNTPAPRPDQWDKHAPSKAAEIAQVNNKNALVSPIYITVMNKGRKPPRRKARILKEIRILSAVRSEEEGIKVFTFKDNIDKWRVLLRGPDGSPYKDRWFYLTIEFPEQYPSAPPTIRFVQPPYHVNISDTGFICLSNLDINYRADDTVHDLLNAIKGLLMCPNVKDPIDPTRIEILKKGNEGEYRNKIQQYNQNNSKPSCDDWLVGWNIERDPEGLDANDMQEYEDVDPSFKCSLTGKLMKEPVLASTGVYFERSALIQYIRSKPKAKCPITGKKFIDSDLNLPVDNSLKVRINQWIEDHKSKD